MQTISSDIYFRAGACGLLSDEEKRKDAEATFRVALNTYMSVVREFNALGFDTFSASFGYTTLQRCFEAVGKSIRSIARERMNQSFGSKQ